MLSLADRLKRSAHAYDSVRGQPVTVKTAVKRNPCLTNVIIGYRSAVGAADRIQAIVKPSTPAVVAVCRTFACHVRPQANWQPRMRRECNVESHDQSLPMRQRV